MEFQISCFKTLVNVIVDCNSIRWFKFADIVAICNNEFNLNVNIENLTSIISGDDKKKCSQLLLPPDTSSKFNVNDLFVNSFAVHQIIYKYVFKNYAYKDLVDADNSSDEILKKLMEDDGTASNHPIYNNLQSRTKFIYRRMKNLYECKMREFHLC